MGKGVELDKTYKMVDMGKGKKVMYFQWAKVEPIEAVELEVVEWVNEFTVIPFEVVETEEVEWLELEYEPIELEYEPVEVETFELVEMVKGITKRAKEAVNVEFP